MSEENPQQPTGEVTNPETSIALPQGYELVINKRTNEIIVKDAAGHSVSLKATIIEDSDEDEDEVEPLTPEEFHEALQKIDALGLTWTADRIPRVKAKEEAGEEVLLSEEFQKIQHDFPTLPQELSIVTAYALTGRSYLVADVGGEDYLKQKAESVLEIVITPAYRSEFFFRHALKVPYLSNIDWEVVFKLQERNVGHIPAVAYALLTLLFHDPNAQGNKHTTTTVALDIVLVNKLMETLTEIKEALEHGQELSALFHDKSKKVVSHANEAE